jgi:ribonuclease P protein subunit RPR2
MKYFIYQNTIKINMRLNKQEQKKIAEIHVKELFEEAEKIFNEDKKLADRYINLALSIKNKYKLRLSKTHKKHFCKKCKCFIMPGKNCIVRIKNKMILYHCKECNNIRRFVIKN